MRRILVCGVFISSGFPASRRLMANGAHQYAPRAGGTSEMPGLGLLLDGLVNRLEGAVDAGDDRERAAAAAASLEAAKAPIAPSLHQRGAAIDGAQEETALAYRDSE